jgi:hypothetical protein
VIVGSFVAGKAFNRKGREDFAKDAKLYGAVSLGIL